MATSCALRDSPVGLPLEGLPQAVRGVNAQLIQLLEAVPHRLRRHSLQPLGCYRLRVGGQGKATESGG